MATNMNCSEYQEDLAAYERLDSDTKNRVDAHLMRCASCTQIRAHDAAILQLIQNDPGLAAGAEFDQRVHSMIHSDRAAAPRLFIFKKPWLKITALAAAAVLGAIAVWKVDFISNDSSPDDEVIANLDMIEPLALLNEALSNDDASLLFAVGSLDPKARLDAVVGASDGEEY